LRQPAWGPLPRGLVMSAFTPKADIPDGERDVRFVPIADMRRFERVSRLSRVL
jgi:hypothetical protein